MGRPWEYPSWRRALMQGVMWAIFAGTLGLAGLVSRSRGAGAGGAAGAGVEVGADAYLVRLPAGWVVDDTKGAVALMAHDAEGRRLVVMTSAEHRGWPADVRREGAIPLEFKGLGLEGLAYVKQAAVAKGDGEVAVETRVMGVATPGPRGRRASVRRVPLVFVLDLGGGGGGGGGELDDEDWALVRRIAAGITPAPTTQKVGVGNGNTKGVGDGSRGAVLD